MAVPVNNEPASATALTTPFGTLSFTTEEATASAGGWANGAGNGLDVWYSLIPQRTAPMLVRWSGTNYLPFVQVFVSTVPGTPLKSSSLSVPNQEETPPRDYDPDVPPDVSDVAMYTLTTPQAADEFVVDLTQDLTYYIRIHGWTGQTPTTGAGVLEWEWQNDPMRLQSPLPLALKGSLAGTLESKFRVVRPTHGHLVYPLLSRQFHLPTAYVVHQGRPIIPLVPMLSDAQLTAQGATVTDPSPITITPPNDVPDPPAPGPPTTPDVPELIWRADTNTTKVGSGWVTGWNTTTGSGPSWASVQPRRPHTGAVGTPKGGSIPCLTFNWAYIEHMWIDFGTIVQPWTVMITGIMSTAATVNQHHHLWDAGGANNSDSGVPGKALIHYRPGNIYSQGPSATIGGASNLNGKPVIVAACYADGNSYVATYGSGNDTLYTGNPGAHSLGRTVLGREKGHISKNYASKMNLFEVRLYKGYINKSQMDGVANSIRTAYRFSDWG